MVAQKIRNSWLSGLASFFSCYEIVGLLSIITLVLFIYVLFSYMAPFQSDESVYVYGGYLIAQGHVPYRDVFLAHPPFMYLVYALLIRLFGANYLSLRLFNIGLYLAICLLAYVLGKLVLSKLSSNKLYSMLIVILCAFYPSASLLYPAALLLENLLMFFSLGIVILYLLYFQQNSNKSLLFFIGIIAGLAMITTLRSIFFVASLYLFHIISLVWRRKFRQTLVDILVIAAGISIPLASLLVVLSYWNVFPQFYLQVFQFSSIFPKSFEERFFNFSWYTNSMFPLSALAIIGTIQLIKSRGKNNVSFLFPAYQYWFVFFILSIGLSTLFHYFFYLTPYLSLLSVIGLLGIKQFPFRIAKVKYTVFMAFSLILVGFATAQGVEYAFNTTLPYFQADQYADIHNYLGKYVANITEPTDRIWTSEGAIGFFSQREIVSPNSTNWPFICFFSDVLGHQADGGSFKSGIVNPKDFIDAFKMNDVKVIVIILGDGWIPYPDSMLWNGFDGQEGIKKYVQDNYVCSQLVTSEERARVPYSYFVWVRK